MERDDIVRGGRWRGGQGMLVEMECGREGGRGRKERSGVEEEGQ